MTRLQLGARPSVAETYRSTVERTRWPDERHDDRMTVIDRTFDHVFEELRAERVGFGAAMRAERAELRAEMRPSALS